jgi:hypothetical protein
MSLSPPLGLVPHKKPSVKIKVYQGEKNNGKISRACRSFWSINFDTLILCIAVFPEMSIKRKGKK